MSKLAYRSGSSAVDDIGAFEETKYPDLKSQWHRAGTGTFRFDPSKAWGRGQEDANLADQVAGGQGVGVTYTCLSPGMPSARVVLATAVHRAYIFIGQHVLFSWMKTRHEFWKNGGYALKFGRSGVCPSPPTGRAVPDVLGEGSRE